ncbi:hypothetical protein P154DRAFT_518192 [Amniculicola lignicola CBS 123094]|uniref:C2 domain-containing protein n=1 Tax=Amniculicola lignicola CBS 123094 TaxID=1392246 RepID=A0A6A5WYA5_9PLEO|nr:hypothetical protein P154DRAFT_518192 [Amniculicola lignicola CBS 123094]
MNAFGSMQHTAGIFSSMEIDGPEIGTLVVVIDRAKNLPNRKSMGKQDPYCAARLGKEAKKTNTDKRGGQTPKWDQELRFTVHDSADYHNLKVSVFNDDKKTELIGETWVSLEGVLNPGGGQSDTWHGLNCRGKYAGEIRIELTYYDTRPKAEKPPVEKRREVARVDGQNPGVVGGPRESTPVKRRPLPSDPTGASPSPANTPDRPRLPAQSGPRSYATPPRQQQRVAEQTPTHQLRNQHADSQNQSVERRRPLPEASPLNGVQVSAHNTPQQPQRPLLESYSASPAQSNAYAPQQPQDGFDMSYTAPKPYEVQAIDQQPQQPRELHNRTMSQNDFRLSQGHAQSQIEFQHSYSAPIVPTQNSYNSEASHHNQYSQSPEPYASGQMVNYDDEQPQPQYNPHEQQYQVEPLRTNRGRHSSNVSPHDPYTGSMGYIEYQPSYDQSGSHGRPPSSMQPTVEDEDDIPPPPPVHRANATTVVHHQQQPPPSYHDDAPAPLSFGRYREEPSQVEWNSPPDPYGVAEYSNSQSSERRYTHPRPSVSPQPTSRPVSRDTMAPSPLRQDTSVIPASLVAGFDPLRQERRLSMVRADSRELEPYQAPSYEAPSYDTPTRQRQLSEPPAEYEASPQYDTPLQPYQLVQFQSRHANESPNYYPHSSPQEPRHTSPVHEPAPIVKPRAVSPADNRMSRTPNRNMPTRKSVSPRPPTADPGERPKSSVPFGPDSFDVLNPTVSRSPNPYDDDNGRRRRSNVEMNEKGQVITMNGRVVDASDHLPLDSWAPEPEVKGTVKDRSARDRPQLSGARDLRAAEQREQEYRRQREQRDRIRSAVNTTVTVNGSPSNALVTSRHAYSSSTGSPMGNGTMVLANQDATPPGSDGRNRLQKRDQRPVSQYAIPTHSSPSGISMSSYALRERENPSGYGGSAGARHSIAAPPIPAKIPFGGEAPPSENMSALSMELASIDIGSRARPRGTARTRYGGY